MFERLCELVVCFGVAVFGALVLLGLGAALEAACREAARFWRWLKALR